MVRRLENEHLAVLPLECRDAQADLRLAEQPIAQLVGEKALAARRGRRCTGRNGARRAATLSGGPSGVGEGAGRSRRRVDIEVEKIGGGVVRRRGQGQGCRRSRFRRQDRNKTRSDVRRCIAAQVPPGQRRERSRGCRHHQWIGCENADPSAKPVERGVEGSLPPSAALRV